jgi:hypothetical protein
VTSLGWKVIFPIINMEPWPAEAMTVLVSLTRILYAHKPENLVRSFNHVFHKVLHFFNSFLIISKWEMY